MKKSKKNTVLKTCVAKAVELAGLVDYAADSVVSKTIIDKPVGTLTLFAFDAGQGLSEHQATYDAVVQIVEGTGIIVISGKQIKSPAGSIIIMPANIPHAVKAKQRFKMLLTMIRA
ncbi:MAG TPA: cupin domain-containing protein [Phycisphaerales bacterium]|nr:MAG: cupin [Planctomycetes bacterium GWC2_45_44]HBG77415.1 cupin domain-containing protein [Phycisphaerales bacterium]HBR20613.1 cupin domain-containing protein [Phycisphaerales bacterium]